MQRWFAMAVLAASTPACHASAPPTQTSPFQKLPATAAPGVPALSGEWQDFQRRARALAQQYIGESEAELQASLRSEALPKAFSEYRAAERARAKRLSTDGWTVRRIGTRPRNPDNAPSKADKAMFRRLQTAHQEEYVGNLNGKDTYWRLLHINDVSCLMCHGDTRMFAKELSALLKQMYPHDEAVGYQPGDIRGAVVVERAATLKDPPP